MSAARREGVVTTRSLIAGTSVTQRLARSAALHPWRIVAAWGLILVASVVVIATLIGSAFTSDGSLTTNPDSAQGRADHRRELRAGRPHRRSRHRPLRPAHR